MVTCATPTFPTPFGYTPKATNCGCGGGCSGGCDGFRQHNQRVEPCCGSEPTVEVTNYLAAASECPDGSIPAIVNTAKTHPFFAAMFSCFDDEVLKDFFCCMGQYDLPGCGDMPVLLAASHFYTLMTTGQRLGTMSMIAQSHKGKPLDFVVTAAKTMKHDAHWNLSFSGCSTWKAISAQ